MRGRGREEEGVEESVIGKGNRRDVRWSCDTNSCRSKGSFTSGRLEHAHERRGTSLVRLPFSVGRSPRVPHFGSIVLSLS